MEPQRSIVTPVLITLILSLIIFGGGGYFLGTMKPAVTPTPLPTLAATPSSLPLFTATPSLAPTTSPSPISWKTYKNSRVGYQFEYPTSGLNLDIDETIKYPDNTTKNEDLVQFATKSITYSVRTYVAVKQASIEAWIQQSDLADGSDLSTYTKTTVGNKTAYMSKQGRYFVMNKTNVYQLEALKTVGDTGIPIASTEDANFQHLVSSFAFTN